MVLVLEMLSCSYLMVSIALPELSAHFHTNQGVWLVTAFLLVGSVASPLLGKLADTYGKRLLLLWCVGLSAVGALISALAPNFAILLMGWSLTGLLSPCLFLVYSLIRDVYPPRTIAMAVSLSTTGMGLIAVPSPFLTGWLVDNFGFRSIFWFFVITLSLLTVLIRFTTEESPVRLRSRIDLVGALLLGLGLAGVLIGVSLGPNWGWTAPSTLAYIVGGLAFLVAWWFQAKRTRDPLIDLALLKMRPVAMTAISSGMCWAVIAAFTVLLPMMAMTPGEMGLGYGFGVDATGYAAFQAPQAITTFVGGILVGAIVGRVAAKKLMVVGLVGMTVGCLALAVSHDSRIPVILFAAVIGFGGGMGYAATPNLLIAAVKPELQATTGAIASTTGNLFPAILPVIVFAVLNSHIAVTVEGSTLYSETGIMLGFLVTAGVALVGLVAALAIPNRFTQVAAPTR
nr:MFS transporter [Rhodococcus sp. HNM0569]